MPVFETEYEESKRLLTETINLTRAAIDRGIIPNLGNVLPDEDISMNSFYKPISRAGIFTVNELLGNLNINDGYGEEDFKQEDQGVDEDNKLLLMEYDWIRGKKRAGVLDSTTTTSWETLLKRHLDTEEKIDAYVEDALRISELKPPLKTPPMVKKHVVKKAGRSFAGKLLGSSKRKKLSPADEASGSRSNKWRKGENHASPKLKMGQVPASTSPPLRGVSLSKSPDKGGMVVKKNRKFITPRRNLNTSLRQVLINSMFSPRTRKSNQDLGQVEVDESL